MSSQAALPRLLHLPAGSASHHRNSFISILPAWLHALHRFADEYATQVVRLTVGATSASCSGPEAPAHIITAVLQWLQADAATGAALLMCNHLESMQEAAA